jgi:predicted dehydrogenase/threonine dehydrogenase-like Zn-dependent dehydrogenase
MHQVLQHLKTGELLLEEVPAPRLSRNAVLVRTTRSVISAGTERMLATFAKSNYLQKAMQQPEKVRQVLDKVRTDGAMTTYDAVTNQLAQPLPMGYCNAGVVLEVGSNVTEFKVGDRVVSNGPHAEVVCVPKNLCAKIPDGVSDDTAAFTVISSIALQGLRLAVPTLGETVVVSGLGLIGLVAVQLFKANGCRVIGFDYNAERVALANALGAEAHDLSSGADPVALAQGATGSHGVDAVLIAAATKNNDLIRQAAQMCRKRGRIVLTGVIGLDLKREDFYEKELTFQVSCSYGPGRYDPLYEADGQDYPFGFVRWTQQRNFQAVLELMQENRLRVDEMISNRYPFSEAPKAYQALDSHDAIGILLEYDQDQEEAALRRQAVPIRPPSSANVHAGGAIGIIGAGPFAQGKLLPGLKKAGARLKVIASSQGYSGSTAGRRFGIEQSVSDHQLVLSDADVSTVVIATPHNTHAKMVLEAIEAGKNVFVEKPLCLTSDELDAVVKARAAAPQPPLVMVGFNRRFAPLAVKMKAAMRGRVDPAFVTFTCNAGHISADSPHHDPQLGGGRIIGEACHFIDFISWLLDQPVVSVTAMKQQQRSPDLEDNIAILLELADGSVGQVNYLSCGAKQYPKERATAMWDGKVAELDNFLRLRTYGGGAGARSLTQDKGHNAELSTLVAYLAGEGPEPMTFASVVNVTQATFAAVESARTGQKIQL